MSHSAMCVFYILDVAELIDQGIRLKHRQLHVQLFYLFNQLYVVIDVAIHHSKYDTLYFFVLNVYHKVVV